MTAQLALSASTKALLRAGEAIGLPRAVIPALIETWGPEETGRRFTRAATRLHGQNAPHPDHADQFMRRGTQRLARTRAAVVWNARSGGGNSS